MTEPIKIISPTGCVHIADGQHGKEYTTLCNHVDSDRNPVDGRWHEWPLTNKQVSCRRCLAKSDSPAHRLKELAIKASDLESDFNQLAKKCEFFFLEDKENADIFHDFQLKFCSHRHRLGTKKNPKRCNLLACPLKYRVVGGNNG
jgi:hypothetical protein